MRTRLAGDEAPGKVNGSVKQSVEPCEESQERRGKQVMVLKNPADDLGIAILGGKDHRLPIIISENGVSDRIGNLDDMQRIYFYKHYLNQLLKGERHK